MIFSTLNIILLACLLVCFVLQLLYWWDFLARPYMEQKKLVQQPEPIVPQEEVLRSGMPDLFGYQPACRPVSVIVCTQDTDPEVLEKNLTAILDQDYPAFELIVINDNLSEESDDVLKRLKYEHRNFYFTYVPEGTKNLSRKKLGLSLGIKAAQYESLLFTEADSRPVGKQWIRNMASQFTDKKSIVLGFNTLAKQNGFRNKYAAFDYFFINLQILSMALRNRTFGANGRNMAYEKRHFSAQKGFSKFRFLQAGADDLFVNEIASKNNIAVDVSPDALVETSWDSLYLWESWKIKRVFTKHYYTRSSVAFWRVESISRFLFLALTVFLIATNLAHWLIPSVAAAVYLIRLASQLFVINKTAQKLNVSKYYFLLPLFDIGQLFVNVYFYFSLLFKRKDEYTWNLGN